MKAKILKVGDKNVELLLDNDVEKVVKKDKLNFGYDIGDEIDIREEGKDYVYSSRKKDKSNKNKLWIIILVFLILLGVGTFLIIKKKHDDDILAEKVKAYQIRQDLNKCVAAAGSALEETLDPTKKRDYAAIVQCYKRYPVSESEEKIREYSSFADEQQKENILNNCLQKAIDDYGYSEQELNDAYGNKSKTIELMTRIVLQDEAKIKCYTDAGKGYDDKIAELRTDKAKWEKMIEDYSSSSTYVVPTPPPAPSYTPPITPTTPTVTMTCEDYHTQFHSTYLTEKRNTTNYYNSMISGASMNCSSSGGCPEVTRLKNELKRELTNLKNQYISNMASVGCDANAYNDF